jgi:hypothetical protein
MISHIRNPWIRRPLLVVAVFVYVPMIMSVRLVDAAICCFWDVVEDVSDAWHGVRVIKLR